MKELFTALNKAQSQIRGALKESTNPHFRSRYADLESVVDTLRKPLADNGLSFIQSCADGYMRTIVCHVSGEQFTSTIPFIYKGDDMQKVGAALTYARRQGLCTTFGVPQVDDDGNEAAGHKGCELVSANQPIPDGVLTDRRIVETQQKPNTQPFKAPAKPKTEAVAKAMQDAGLNPVAADLFPLFVEGRDNDAVVAIMKSQGIDTKLLTKHGAALKKYLSETRKETDLLTAIQNFFMSNK